MNDSESRQVKITEVQGNRLNSPLAGEVVIVRGVLTGFSKRGFFLQEPGDVENILEDLEGCSTGIFVYLPGKRFPIGVTLAVRGRVEDFCKGDPETDKPITQIRPFGIDRVTQDAIDIHSIKPVVLSAILLKQAKKCLPQLLNRVENMLIKLEEGAEFIQPSNHFGDYVVLPKDTDKENFIKGIVPAEHGGIIFSKKSEVTWLPSFRIISEKDAPMLNMAATLESDVIGPMHFRSNNYQIQVNHEIEVKNKIVERNKTRFELNSNAIIVMTLNCLNLDPVIESASKVVNPVTDIDDDIGSGQFRLLAEAIVNEAKCPDIIALQEIQDNDGAEQSNVVRADLTYKLLIRSIEFLGGSQYEWIDIPPESGEDGGQPGGNIRNGYLYRPDRIELIKASVKRLAENDEAYDGSRKPLQATFKQIETGQELIIINVHLASKRHQQSLFSPGQPGLDPKEEIRMKQAEIIEKISQKLREINIDYYITGDFNDFDESPSINTLLGKNNINLLYQLPENQRYDYNHRGKLHVLMHGIVSKELAESGRAEYEILHGNELIGVRPGQEGGKGSDHAYVIAKISRAI